MRFPTMPSRLFSISLCVLLCASATLRETQAAPDKPAAAKSAAPPNVLFLICDDLNCDMGLYGHPLVKTPNVDRLAKRGVRFDNAHCQFPLCGPSRASFMTGLYPDQNLVHRNGVYIREKVPNVMTISQMFRENGYFATRIGKIYHYNVPKHIGTSGHDDPYSWNYTINPRGRDVTEEPLITTLKAGTFGATLSWLAAEGGDGEQTDGIAATEAIRQIEAHAADKVPFYLAVGLYRPHTPYVAPKKYFAMHPIDKIELPTVPDDYYDTIPEPARKSVTRKKEHLELKDDIRRQVLQSYYASISFADAQVGRILDALEVTGLEENTIVLFTSDHGYHMGEHGHYQKTTLFQNATHVPLVIAGPGVTARGKASNSPAEMVDFYPTLAELAGIKPPEHISGVSLVPVLKDPAASPRKSAFTQYANGYSIRDQRYRYTEWGDKGADGTEFYDHESDPAEMTNLAANPEHAAKVKELSTQLQARVTKASVPPQRRHPEQNRQPPPHPHLQQIRPQIKLLLLLLISYSRDHEFKFPAKTHNIP